MSRTWLITYLSALSFCSIILAVWITRLLESAKHTFNAMLGGQALPNYVMAAPSFGPAFYVLSLLYVGSTVTAALRPSWNRFLMHAMLLLLITQTAAILLCIGGLVQFFLALDSGMSGITE